MISKTFVAAFCAASLTLAFSSTAFAQDTAMKKMPMGKSAGQYTTKTIEENEKVTVTDNVYRPGDTSPMASHLGQVSYFVQGGTMERTYADGSKEVTTRKTGETLVNKEKRQYSLKNIGKTTFHSFTVSMK